MHEGDGSAGAVLLLCLDALGEVAVEAGMKAGRVRCHLQCETVEKEVPHDFAKWESISVNLYRPDFTTAARLAGVIGSASDGIEARHADASTVMVRWKEGTGRPAAELIAFVENLDVSLDRAAVVVMNEKTGTVVMGENVQISTMAVAHGNLSIQIKEQQNVSQPLPYAPRPPERSMPVKKGCAVFAP